MEGIQSPLVSSGSDPSGSLAERLDEAALRAGFLASGAVDLDAGLASPEFREHLAAYDRWLAERRHAPMEYLVRGRDRKANPRLVFPETQSVFCVLEPYSAQPLGSLDPAVGPRFARYLRGSDYHDRVADKLERVVRDASLGRAEPLTYKICVDTSAVLERTWAYLAGLGWIGKNTLLLHPQHGSYHFIGVALLSAPVGLAPRPMTDRCGHCTRCLSACPTNALRFDSEGGRGLDATRCISTWNLETRGELALTPKDSRAMGTWVAGCDLCQEACPFNVKRAKSDAPAAADELPLPLDWAALTALAADPTRTRETTRGSAIERVKPEMLARNLKIALGNRR